MATEQLGPNTRIKTLAGVGTDESKSHAVISIVTADDVPHSFWCKASDLPHAAATLLSLGQYVVQQAGEPKPPSETVTAKPIAAVSIKLAEGRTASEALVCVDLGLEQPMVFAVSLNTLAALRDTLNAQLFQVPSPQ